MNLQDVASKYNVSDRTISRHRQTIEERYGIEIAQKVGRETIFDQQYLYLLEWSVKGLPLPVSIEQPPDFLMDGEVLEPVVDAEVQSESVAITVINRSAGPGRSIAPMSLTLGRLDTSALDQSTETNLNTLKTLTSVTNQVIEQLVSSEAEVLQKNVEDIMVAAVARGKANALNKIASALQD